LLGLISFFTVGPDEVRAWTVRRGAHAVEAAGEIHSDMERGFIRAQVVDWRELGRARRHGGRAHARPRSVSKAANTWCATGTAWRSDSTHESSFDPSIAPRRRARGAGGGVRAGAGTASARAAIQDVTGHVSLGYAKLFGVEDAPGGSLSVTGGLDHPLWRDVRIGAGLGFHLLGGRTVTRGSLFANVDYSLFEAVLFAHWKPPGLGPIGRISPGRRC